MVAFLHRYSFESFPPLLGHTHRFDAERGAVRGMSYPLRFNEGKRRCRVYRNLIGGQWVAAATGKTFLNHNPANTDDVVGEFQSSGAADVDRAVQAARAAYRHWRLVPAPKRGEMLYRTGELLLQHKERLARDMTREMGKVLSETRGDVQEAADTAFYMAGEGRRLFGQTTPSELKDKFAMSVRMPVGVCGMIAPWNFPMAIPSWKLFPALGLRQHLRDQAGGGYAALDHTTSSRLSSMPACRQE
jgi:hypothetical protein